MNTVSSAPSARGTADGRKQLLMQATSRLSVAVLVNVETTPVQLHAILFPSGDATGEEFLRVLTSTTPEGVGVGGRLVL